MRGLVLSLCSPSRLPSLSPVALAAFSRRRFMSSSSSSAGGAPADTFHSAAEHLASLEPASALPRGFRVGTHGFTFSPAELPAKTAKMTLTLIALERPTRSFAAMFTTNAFPGAPVVVGRKRLAAPDGALQAIVINNKISNVCAPGGVEDSERVCAEVARALSLPSPEMVLPSSTGVIG